MKIWNQWPRGGSSNRIAWLALVAATLMLVVAVAGCGRLDLIGNPKANQPPELLFVNIPVDGAQFSANPVVHWFGSDVDGRVVRYDYAVIPESTVQSFVDENGCPAARTIAERFINCASDEDFGWISIFVDSIGSDQLPTRGTIQLFASFDTLDCDSQVVEGFTDTEPREFFYDTVAFDCVSKYVPQFMFIRAIDELGASSDIKYRSFLRNNHWPESEISSDFELQSRLRAFFSLPELTQTYRGIQFAYGGSDRSDFLRDAPPLEYYWRVYGPFDERPTSLSDTLLPNGAPRDTIISSWSSDPRRAVWTRDTTASMYNLWKSIDAGGVAPDTTRKAFFLLVVTARDDAFVPDPVPEMVGFEAIYPRFERDLLVISDNLFIFGSLATPTCGPTMADAGNPDCLHESLKRIATEATSVVLNSSGWDEQRDWLEYDDRRCIYQGGPKRGQERINCVDETGISLDDLARHKLVLYHEADIDKSMKGIAPDTDMRLMNYLDVGGKLWLVSRIPFMPGTSRPLKGARSKIFDFLAHGFGRFPREYFNMEGAWWPAWQNGIDIFNPSEAFSNDEFIGADLAPDLVGQGLPLSLDIDQQRADDSYMLVYRDILSNPVRGVPEVPFAVRGSQSRTVYRFRSYRPGLNNAHGAVVGMRFVGPDRSNPRYKTAWFGCPLYFIKEDQAIQMAKGMLDWFLNKPLEVL